MRCWLRRATQADADAVAADLRPEDAAEIKAGSGLPAPSVLRASVALSSQAWAAGAVGEGAFVVFGVRPSVVEGVGHVWMLGTPGIITHRYEFLRRGREFLPVLHHDHPILTNLMDERNTVHAQWLRWLGFGFLRRFPTWGAEGRPFLQFARLDPRV